jgi:glycosyltransferase involved in cell wall biosynthesis
LTAFALSPYPLSAAFRRRLDDAAAEPVEVHVLPELRRLGLGGLAARLFSLDGRCFLAVEDPGSEPLLPVVEVLAALTRARQIEVMRADGTLARVSRLDAARSLAGVAAASLDAQRALRAAGREAVGLLAAPRVALRVSPGSVLYLNANLWFGLKVGGSIAHVAGVVNGFLERGLDVTLATATEPVSVAGGASVIRLAPPRWFGLPVESNLYRFGLSVPEQVRAASAAAGFVYQRLSVGNYAGTVVARERRIPLVLEYNGSEVWVARNWGRPLRYEALALAAENASLRHADVVVTVSDALRRELVERGVEPERIVWHPNGVDPSLFENVDASTIRSRYRISDDATLVAFVGTFGQWHGTDVLARAIRRDVEWAREHRVHYLLVGDGLRMPEVRRELEGLEDVVTLTGLVPQAEAPAHLLASDILVSPHVPNDDGSPFFGSPTKLFEYMAAGRGIVASDLDQIGEILRDDLAVLVRPGDVAALAEGIRSLVSDPGRRDELGRRAQARVRERYTWRHHVDAIVEHLERV